MTNIVFTFTKKEIKSFFKSIKAPMIFFLFLIFLGSFFYSFIGNLHFIQQQATVPIEKIPSVDDIVSSMYHNLHFVLLLVIPAITMSMFSGEEKAKTDKLLLSSPIVSWQISLGKLIGSLIICLSLLTAASVYQLYLVVYGGVDYGIFMSSFMGFSLLCLSHVSFGVWVSSLCKTQTLSFLFTLFGMLLMLVMGWLAPMITANSFLEYLFQYLAALPHLDSFLQGVIKMSDVVYFVGLSVFFLVLTVLSVDSRKWR